MRLRELIALIEATVISGAELVDELEVESCFAADLMSDVLAFSHPRALLITGLTSVQSAHTADVADLAAILFVAGKSPAVVVRDLASRNKLPLLSTPRSMYEACGILFRAGLGCAHRIDERKPEAGPNHG